MCRRLYRELRIPLCAGLVLGASFGATSTALGQTNPDPAKLFEEGKADMAKGDYENGCPKLQTSYDLEPKFGRLYTLALCRDRQERTATALALYKDYLTGTAELDDDAKKSHADRMASAAERVRALKEAVPRIKMVWRGDIPEDIDVQLDGRDALPRLNTDLPLDPGDHIITTRKKGRKDDVRTVTLQNGQPTREVDLTPAEVHPVTVEVKPAVPDVAIVPQIPAKPPAASNKNPSGGFSQRTLGFMWFGVAGVGGLAASIMGIKAATMTSDVEKGCPRQGVQLVCSTAGAAALDEGMMWGNAASTTLVLSGALAIVGAVELTRHTPKKSAMGRPVYVRVEAGQRQGMITLEGRF